VDAGWHSFFPKICEAKCESIDGGRSRMYDVICVEKWAARLKYNLNQAIRNVKQTGAVSWTAN
jgi:hypothetical protein